MYTLLAMTNTCIAENVHSSRHTALFLSLPCMFSKSESVSLFIACAHSLTSGGVVHVKVDLHLDSVQGRRGHIQQVTYTSLKREGEGGKGHFFF